MMIALSVIAFSVLLYFLYCQGCAVTKKIAALLFVFRSGKHGDYTSLNSCTGWVRHRGRFRHDGIYEFYLECQLSRGEVEIILLDHQERELLRLDRERNNGKIELSRHSRYNLRWEFQNATGKCMLGW